MENLEKRVAEDLLSFLLNPFSSRSNPQEDRESDPDESDDKSDKHPAVRAYSKFEKGGQKAECNKIRKNDPSSNSILPSTG